MAYDSETYGQSPFGSPKKPTKKPSASEPVGPKKGAAAGEGPSVPVAPSVPGAPNVPGVPTPFIDDGLDQGPGELDTALPKKTGAAAMFPPSIPTSVSSAFPKSLQPNIPPSVSRLAGKLGLGKAQPDSEADVSRDSASRKSRATTKTTAKSTTTKSTTGKSSRKSKKTKAAEAAKAEAEAAEAAIARRFQEEDRNAYISLLYKTGVSFLIWAVLRLSRHELSEDADAIINLIIHPLLISLGTLIAVVAMTFWLRHLLNDLARHTRQLNVDAEETGGKNYRPTLEIVGDSLEYNPKLRKNVALLWHGASTLICTLVSYLITSALFP